MNLELIWRKRPYYEEAAPTWGTKNLVSTAGV